MPRRTAAAAAVLMLPALLWVLLLLVIPQLKMLDLSLRFNLPIEQVGTEADVHTLVNYHAFVTNPLYWKVFLKTLYSAVVITLVSFLVAFPVAYAMAKLASGSWRRRLLILILIPFWVNEIVRTYAWVLILTEHGVLNQVLQALGLMQEPVSHLYRDSTVVIGMTYAYMLFMIFPLYAVLESLDTSLIEAAQDLGAHWLQVLRHIILPHAIPGAAAGGIMVFMLSVGTFVVPSFLGGKGALWFVELIYRRFYDALNWNLGSAFSFILLALSMLFVVGVLRLFGIAVRRVIQAS
ncbi:MAG: ABC transporter permease [Armatimonadetes bacterium]|nr:ABC transporter permease [Armatimonadota bacterium]MBI2247911.1 ABC transporter permease [Armatimonadota bacterium]